jgi:hypothetical protein
MPRRSRFVKGFAALRTAAATICSSAAGIASVGSQPTGLGVDAGRGHGTSA